jgi:formylglycine-generating enzyme required for sulfatase activity
MTGDRYGITEDGVGTIIIDPVKAFGTSKVALANFKVKLSISESAANINEVLYRIVDLDTGEIVDVKRADFYGNKYGTYEESYTAVGGVNTKLSEVFIWTGVTNDPAYVTSKLALRRIPAKTFGSWLMGDTGVKTYAASAWAGMTQHLVQLTEDYFISVFPVTQAQYEKLTGSRGFGSYTNKTTYPLNDAYPAVAEWWDIRGSESWPDNHNVDSAKFLGLLRSKTGGSVLFDMPTEAQWELACRAGWDVNEAYTGASQLITSTLKKMGWCMVEGDEKYDGSQHPVGLLVPTPFGIYDMLGNCSEWCLDLMFKSKSDYTWTSTTEPEINPVGAAKADGYAISGYYYHAFRSPSCNQIYTQMNICVHTYRQSHTFSGTRNDFGFRVCCAAE